MVSCVHRSFQARNAFAPIEDPPFNEHSTDLRWVVHSIRSEHSSSSPLNRRRRNESGFFTSNVSQGLTGSVTIPVIAGLNPIARTFNNITPAQAAFIKRSSRAEIPLLSAARVHMRSYKRLRAAGTHRFDGSTAFTSPNDGSGCPAISPIAPGAIGPRFILSGAPVPRQRRTLPGSSSRLDRCNNLQWVFPVTDRTTFNSFRLDHLITPRPSVHFPVWLQPKRNYRHSG